jgi:hypothetical protein
MILRAVICYWQKNEGSYLSLTHCENDFISNVFHVLKIIPRLHKVHCKCFDHKNYGDWKLWGPCRDPAISSPRCFYGQNICSVCLRL